MKTHSHPARAAFVTLIVAALATAPCPARAGTEAVVYDFKSPATGDAPSGPLTKIGNLFYGVTATGGAKDLGTLYTVTPGGAHKLLHDFEGGADGANPAGSLLTVDGTIYGTTRYGGAGDHCSKLGCGTVFSLAPDGTYTVLHAFAGAGDGLYPAAGLVSLGGVFYGTTTRGGKCDCGTVFSITPAGAERLVHVFQDPADGHMPGGLTVAGTMLYGITQYGGAYSRGNVFSLDPSSGAEAVLYNFDNKAKGQMPIGTLLYDGRALYGTTVTGGTNTCLHSKCGTVFKLSLAGKLTVLHSFTGADGAFPWAGLVSSHGVFYGNTYGGGSADGGTVYAITRQGAVTVIASLGAVAGDALQPQFTLTAAGNTLFGTTAMGGAYADCHGLTCGTVYRVTP